MCLMYRQGPWNALDCMAPRALGLVSVSYSIFFPRRNASDDSTYLHASQCSALAAQLLRILRDPADVLVGVAS